MVSNREVAKAFARGQKATGNNMYSEGRFCCSWGSHFPISVYLGNDIYLFNTDGYSSSTAKHKYYVRSAIRGKIIECTTDEIKRAVDYPNEPVVITKTVQPNSIEHGLEILRDLCHEKGMKIFPMESLKTYFYDKCDLEKEKKHKSSVVFGGNKLSIKHGDCWSTIRYNKQEMKILHKYAGDVCNEFAHFTNGVYRADQLSLIREKFKNIPEVADFVWKVLSRQIVSSPELLKQIEKEHEVIEAI